MTLHPVSYMLGSASVDYFASQYASFLFMLVSGHLRISATCTDQDLFR